MLISSKTQARRISPIVLCCGPLSSTHPFNVLFLSLAKHVSSPEFEFVQCLYVSIGSCLAFGLESPLYLETVSPEVFLHSSSPAPSCFSPDVYGKPFRAKSCSTVRSPEGSTHLLGIVGLEGTSGVKSQQGYCS